MLSFLFDSLLKYQYTSACHHEIPGFSIRRLLTYRYLFHSKDHNLMKNKSGKFALIKWYTIILVQTIKPASKKDTGSIMLNVIEKKYFIFFMTYL